MLHPHNFSASDRGRSPSPPVFKSAFPALDTDGHAPVATAFGNGVQSHAKDAHRHGRVRYADSRGNQHRGIDMRAPAGSIVGLCSASATMCAVGMAFLGYWDVHEPSPWHWTDRFVVLLAFASFAALGSVAWIVTTPVAEEGAERVVAARRAFALGVVSIWLAIVIAVIGSP
jgi:hypothetical protein